MLRARLKNNVIFSKIPFNKVPRPMIKEIQNHDYKKRDYVRLDSLIFPWGSLLIGTFKQIQVFSSIMNSTFAFPNQIWSVHEQIVRCTNVELASGVHLINLY